MRNTPDGCIWQAYEVRNDVEQQILTRNARANGFMVCLEDAGYTTETSPGWWDTPEWKDCLARHTNTNKEKEE